jgi:hypothetical protein
VILLQASKVSVHGPSDLRRVLYGQEMINQLCIVVRLARKALSRVSALEDFNVWHDLDDKRGLRHIAVISPWRNSAIHQRRSIIEEMEKLRFKSVDRRCGSCWVCLDLGNFPNIDLSVGDDV